MNGLWGDETSNWRIGVYIRWFMIFKQLSADFRGMTQNSVLKTSHTIKCRKSEDIQ